LGGVKGIYKKKHAVTVARGGRVSGLRGKGGKKNRRQKRQFNEEKLEKVYRAGEEESK